MFISIFKDEFNEFIKYKKSLGYVYRKETIYWYDKLDKYFYENNLTRKEINKEIYDEWLIKRENESNNTYALRYTAIRQFCIYLIQNNYKNIYYSDEYNIKYKKEFIPHIYTEDEIIKIFELSSNIDLTFEVIIKLLYSTGLRISEALNIELDNVNLKNNQIYIINGKNNVSRIIVMSDSMSDKLKEYINSKAYFNNKYLFSSKGNKYGYNKFKYNYKKILSDLNINARIHDLRHTFAVNALNQMVVKGYDVYTSLPLLSQYMGHRRIESTEYYLRFIEKYYDDVTNAVNNYYGNIYQNLEVEYE